MTVYYGEEAETQVSNTHPKEGQEWAHLSPSMENRKVAPKVTV